MVYKNVYNIDILPRRDEFNKAGLLNRINEKEGNANELMDIIMDSLLFYW